VVGVLAEGSFGARVPGEEVPVDTVELGTVDGQAGVVVVESVALAGRPAVCFLDDLDLLGAVSALGKVVDLESEPEVRGNPNERGVFGQDGVAPDKVLAGPHAGLDVGCDLDRPMECVLGDGPDLDTLVAVLSSHITRGWRAVYVQDLGTLALVREVPLRSDLDGRLMWAMLCRSWYDELTRGGGRLDPSPAILGRRRRGHWGYLRMCGCPWKFGSPVRGVRKVS
jgi:hypothetical protein